MRKYYLLLLLCSIAMISNAQEKGQKKLHSFLSKTSIGFETRYSIMSSEDDYGQIRGLIPISYTPGLFRYTLQNGVTLMLDKANSTYESYYSSGIEVGYNLKIKTIGFEPYLGVGIASSSDNFFSYYDFGVNFKDSKLPYLSVGTGVSIVSYDNDPKNIVAWFLSFKIDIPTIL